MAMSTADYFRMMQGGVDRTGYADMMPDRIEREEPLEDRLSKLIAQNEAEEPGDEELGGDISEEDELSIMQSLFGDDEGSFTSDEAVGQNALLAASFPAIGAAYKGGQKLIEPIAGKVTKESIEKAAETAGGKGFMKYFARRAPAMLAKRGALAATGVGAVPAALSLIPELAYMGADYFAPEATDKFEKAVGSGIKTGASAVGSGLQSANDYLRNLAGIDNVESEDTRTEDEVARDNEIASQYFMNPYNNGGRVGLQNGGNAAQPMGAAGQPSSVYGLGSLLSGMQQSMGPTFRTADFRDSNNDGVDDRDQGMGISPSIPGDEKNPGMDIGEILASLQSGMPQAYTPYVSAMPLYDPSTLGTGLPSTAGGYDPYVSYDPYAPVGAFSRPPSESTGFLTEEEIKKGFEDMDRFSLAAQEAKRKAAEEAAKKKKQGPEREGGGGGGNQNNNNNNNSNNNTGTGVAGAGIDGYGGPDSNYG